MFFFCSHVFLFLHVGNPGLPHSADPTGEGGGGGGSNTRTLNISQIPLGSFRTRYNVLQGHSITLSTMTTPTKTSLENVTLSHLIKMLTLGERVLVALVESRYVGNKLQKGCWLQKLPI